jgi:hypothetical protein
MLLFKNLEVVSANKKNPLIKQKNNKKSLKINDLGNIIVSIDELKEESKKTNYLLEQLLEHVLKSPLPTFQTNQQDNIISKTSKLNKNKKEYIPSPDISKVTTSNKKITNQTIDSDDLQDTLKSLSQMQK